MAFVKITSIDQLNKNLNLGPGYGGYDEFFHAIELPKSEWENFCTWRDNRYTRNCISACDEYELLLMCWQKEHSSPIHSFQFQEGWIKVLEGELTIQNYEIDRDKSCCHKKGSLTLKAGESTYLNDNMGFHQITNSFYNSTVSLHLNIERVVKWEVFRACRQEIVFVHPLLDSKSADCEVQFKR
ncbi:MAG: cysteine dioxygenase family protein [Flavobacteriales bacterium]|nr:cysteine dioxygenase family protein [Flavobacteriales bacterium]